MRTRMRVAAAAGVLMGLAMLAAATPRARADFVLVWEPNQSTTSLWDYSAFFNTQIDPGTGQPAESLVSGSFVTLYDFGGYVPGSLAINPLYASEFTITQQNTGITPSGITVPHDLASLPNFTATYTGPTLTTSTSFVDLFTLQTTFTGQTPGGSNFAGQDIKASGPSTGTPVASFGFITTPSAVPEPASLVLLGIGTLVVFGAYRHGKSRRLGVS